jgi:CTP:molybdopterin cytidylyltransferase MocA
MGAFKPLLPLGGTTIIGRVIAALREGGAEDIGVITGWFGEALEESLKDEGVLFIRNPAFARTDMFYSACLGFSALADRVDGLFFSPGDVPLFKAATVRSLADHLGEGPVLIPSYQGRKGHPILLSSHIVRRLVRTPSSRGLRGAFGSLGVTPLILETEDPGILFDADTPEDYERARMDACSPLSNG